MTGLLIADQFRGVSQEVQTRWRAAWVELSAAIRAFWMLVVGLATVGTVLLGGQLGSADFMLQVSTWTYAVVPVGAGVLLALAALLRRWPGWAAWTLIGVGVGCWGVGELIWQYYAAVLGQDVPYPGWADLFYVVAYPIMFAGVLMLPHVQPRKWERARLSLDAMAGTVALAAIVWTFYLRDAIHLDPEAGLLESAINLAYPAGDLILLVALMILATRRSQLQFDGRLLFLSLGMLITALADMAYVSQTEADTYFDGGRLDALWLAGYGLFAATALLVAGPPRLREQADRPGRVWPMIAPYTAIAVLFALTLGELDGQATLLQVAAAVVGLLIIARQGVAIRETREVVEKQRNDLVASISHELRTPLTAMAGFTEILDEQPDLDRTERVEMISIVNSQTKHLTRIVGDLVEVARDKLDHTTLTYTTIDVATLVDSATGMLTTAASTARINTDIQPGLTVSGDIDRLRQVLVNYLTNASRYGNGIVQVNAHTTDNGQTIIEVHDNGPGIPKKHEITIWDRFERGAHTHLSKVQGSGLGLAIARQLVTAHHGHTGHHPSKHLGGACFWLTLPSTTPHLQTTRAAATIS
ncbi:MAG: HAMP domain-containing sensor histidine kinase [Acidimicrobiia bacterium]